MLNTNHFVLTNIAELVTLEPLVQNQRFHAIKESDLGRKRDAWIHIRHGKVEGYGLHQDSKPPLGSGAVEVSCRDKIVLPGFVDGHTHPCFGGDRSLEFVQRIEGATYQEIAQAGGGIKKTVAMTREASLEELTAVAVRHAEHFLQHGVTSFEAKSGYGLSVKEELKLLQALNHMKLKVPQDVSVTCLALHAVPVEARSKEDFISSMTHELLPEVHKQKLCRFVDAFVEKGYFEVDETRPYLQKALDLGFDLRLHVDEFTDLGGGGFGAEMGAKSCDHLEYCSIESAEAMAEAGTVATLLPGTSLYTRIKYAEAPIFRKAQVPIAIATDFNPGSCRFYNISFIAAIGALYCGLTLSEALAAITWVPAKSLGIHDRKGALSKGMDADFNVFTYKTCEQWLADCGQSRPVFTFTHKMTAVPPSFDFDEAVT